MHECSMSASLRFTAPRDCPCCPQVDTPAPSEFSDLQKPLEHFRAKTKRLQIHPRELLLLGIIGLHVVFLP